MRVALVAPDCNKRDGQARYVSEIAERLGRRHEVHVFSVGFDDTDPALARHRPVAAPRHAARARFFAFLASATAALARERFDVVHGLGASSLAMDVLTAQFCQAAWDEVLRQEAPQLAGSPVDAGLRALIASVERAVFSSPRTSRLVVVSRRVARDVARFYGRESGVSVLPQGVDLDRFHPRLRASAGSVREALGIPAGRFAALFLGEFERKNLRTLVEAMRLVTDPRVVLVAVGGSDPAPYRELARARGVEGRVLITGRTPEPERVLAAADAFVFPTLYDPFGTVTLEAAACGTAVLTSDRPGFAESLEHGRSGLVLPDPLDASAFARALDALAGDPAGTERMGREGRAVAEGFSWERVALETERVWEEARALRPGASDRPPGGS